MQWWQAIVLGVVEGLTEYLPVSSTGHLLLAQRAMNIPASAAANAFAICIQAGAIVAVLGLYRHRVREMVAGVLGRLRLIRSPNERGWRLAVNIVVAFLPAAVIGVLFDERIERYLFGLWPIVIAWLVGGAAILIVAWWWPTERSQGGKGASAGAKTSAERPSGRETSGGDFGGRDASGGDAAEHADLFQLTWQGALAIGLIQCLAMWPGTSRSLVTIVGGVVVGLSLGAAVEFSFLLGVLTLLAATVYKAQSAGPVMLAAYGWGPMLLGSVAAWISAVGAVRWMIAYLRRFGLAPFGYYRVALAVLVAILIFAGHLSPR